MNSSSRQFDLFNTGPEHHAGLRPVPATRRNRVIESIAADDEQAQVERLEETGRYRILRKLVPRPVLARTDSSFPHLGVLVDTETTGLQHMRDEVIEIGAVAFTYDDDGTLGDVVGVFNGLQEPSIPIPPEITQLTGITNEMVAGQRIDLAALDALIGPADLIIAHNAGFDRPFCEKLTPSFIPKAWACSVSEIRWSDHGFEGSKLGYLVGQSGLFHDGHRATDDCHALLEVLAQSVDDGATTPFAELLAASNQTLIRMYAQNSPFDMKDHLKARGYRWSDGSDGRPKSWWVEVNEGDYEEELHFLRTDIYRWQDAKPLAVRLTACERFKGQ